MPKFREISGQFVGYIPDSIDSDIVPDRAPMSGRVTFTPVFTGGVIAFPELSPPEFAHPRTIHARIVDGFVQVEVNEGEGDDEQIVLQPLSLMVTVDDEASQVWSWRAEFDEILIGASDEYVKIPSWSFRVPDGTGPVDLTELVPLKSSGTVDVTKGPRGAGLENITAIDGQLVFAYTDGQEATVPIPEAVQGPQGEPGPAGADGEQGPEGPQGPPGEIPDLLVGNITDATPTGKNLMLAATEGAARNVLGLQTGATAIAGGYSELENGTQTNSRVWSPKNISDYVESQVVDGVGEASEYTLEKLTTTKRNIADFTDRLKPLINIPARPEGSLWPQGIAVDDAQGVIYVCYTGYIDSQYNVRIARFDFDGNLIDFKSPRSADNNPTVPMTSSESIPFWWNAGKLYFLLATGTNGRGRLVYNFTDNTVGDIVETLGGYRGDFDGDFYVTSDSNDSTNGVSRLFYYDANDMKHGVETLVRTVRLQFRARRRKLQGLTTHEGVTVGLTGPASEVPGIIAWSQNGNQLYSYEYDPVQFGELVNSVWPGTITDTGSYHREPEGATTDSAGRLYFGSVINNGSSARFVAFRTGDPTQPQVLTRPDSETVDSDWQELVITNTTDFEPWSVGSRVEWRRIGAIVCIRGEVRTKTSDWSGKQLGTLAGLGRGVVPLTAVSQVQQGSGNGRYAATVSSSGPVTLGRSDASLNEVGTWLNINVMFMTD